MSGSAEQCPWELTVIRSTTIYYGQATPRQYTVLDSNKYFKPEYVKATRVRSRRSKRLLDEGPDKGMRTATASDRWRA